MNPDGRTSRFQSFKRIRSRRQHAARPSCSRVLFRARSSIDLNYGIQMEASDHSKWHPSASAFPRAGRPSNRVVDVPTYGMLHRIDVNRTVSPLDSPSEAAPAGRVGAR